MPNFRLSEASFIGLDWYPLPRALISDTEQNTIMPEIYNRYEANKSKPQFHSNCIPLIIFNAFIGFSYNNRYFT